MTLAPASLKRSIGLVRATAMVVGTIVGASIFVQPSVITGAMRSVAGVVLVWTLAGLLTLVGALICAELASAYPESGGVYVFLREEYSPALGFLWGWAMFWSMHSGIIAAIVVVSAVNYVGVAAGSGLQAAFTIAKIVAIAGVVAAGFWLGAGLPAHFVGAAEPHTVSVGGFAAAVAAGLFAYGGWHMVTYTAEETREPRRVIPRALAIGTLIVTTVYVALNAVYLYVLPVDRVIASDRVAADVAAALLGPRSAAPA